MPIYEYSCQSCGHQFEAIQKINDAALSECPVCSKPELKKMITAAGFHLKGSGWYATDFKGGAKKTDSSGSGTGGGCGGGACGGGGCGA
jgi:putative FmdB family regulatory protein